MHEIGSPQQVVYAFCLTVDFPWSVAAECQNFKYFAYQEEARVCSIPWQQKQRASSVSIKPIGKMLIWSRLFVWWCCVFFLLHIFFYRCIHLYPSESLLWIVLVPPEFVFSAFSTAFQTTVDFLLTQQNCFPISLLLFLFWLQNKLKV